MGIGEGQLALPFDASSAVRRRRALAARAAEVAAAEADRPRLFAPTPDVDVSLADDRTAVAELRGSEPALTAAWLRRLVGPLEQPRLRAARFPADRLDRLVWIRPPAQATLDAAAGAVGRALWAHRLGLPALRARRRGSRVVASSGGWPAGLSVRDAPWPAIAALIAIGVPVAAHGDAARVVAGRVARRGGAVASAGRSGSSVLLTTDQPALLEALDLPALSYAGGPGSGRYRMPLAAAAGLLTEPSVRVSDDLAAAIRQATRPVRPLPADQLAGFPWRLYDFQARDAAAALRTLRTSGGVLLAGDMGSGKTTVSLAVVHVLQAWPLLVVAPLAAFSTWQRQLGELGVRFLVASGPAGQVWQQMAGGGYDAVVVSYDRLHAFVELVEQAGFAAIVADEIQRIRTPTSRRSRALRAVAAHAPVRIGLTGTPLTNRIEDLLAPGAFLTPGEWRPRSTTRDLADLYPGDDPVGSVAAHLRTLMVRRRMVDTGVRLPGKSTRRVPVPLTGQQRRAVAAVADEAAAARAGGALTRHTHVFSRLQRLRRIVSCPDAVGVPGGSPKAEASVQLVEQFASSGRKTVVFTAYRATWQMLADTFDGIGVGWVGIRGATSPADRVAAERRFHQDRAVQVFLGTLQACSEALTLSPTATAVVFNDYSYSPAELWQAEARAYRLNTIDPVDIVYLHADGDGGLDDRFVEILTAKQALFAEVVDGRPFRADAELAASLDDLIYLLTGAGPPDGHCAA